MSAFFPRFRILLVRLNDPGHQRVADNVGRREVGERNAADSREHMLSLNQTAECAARQANQGDNASENRIRTDSETGQEKNKQKNLLK